MALDDEDLKPLWDGEVKIALLGSFSFKFFTRLAAVFAEEVGDFGIVFVIKRISNGLI